MSPFHSPSHSNPSVSFLPLCPRVRLPDAPVSSTVLPLKKSKPIQAWLLRPFVNGPLPTERVPLFLEPFLPGFQAISEGASVFPLREAWRSLLAGCDNGPHMVVLQRLTKTLGPWCVGTGPGSASSPSNPAHKALFFSAFCQGPFHLA